MGKHSGLLRAFGVVLILVAAARLGVAQPVPKGQTIEINDMEMYVEIVGEGEPLLLLHSGTHTCRMFDPFVPLLCQHYRLIIPDLRGHGASTNPANLWTTRQFASDIEALLEHLQIDRFRAIGASAGGMTLLHLATMEPERVSAMVVIGVGTYLPNDCRQILARTSPDRLSAATWETWRAEHKHGQEQMLALVGWIASLAQSYNDMTFSPALLSTITAPTLIIHGDRDYCFPASMAVDVYSAIPTAYLWILPNGGHVPINESNAEPFVSTVLAFFSGSWNGP